MQYKLQEILDFLESISESELKTQELVFVMVFIACFVTNILYYLFGFIKNLNIEKPESIFKDKAIISFNVIMLVVLICDGVIYFLHKYFG